MNSLRRSLIIALLLFAVQATAAEPKRWNILWISCEDTSPDLGCYGDKYAVTPNLDKLASQGALFTRAFTHAGVCAPSRSGIITGMYPSTMGTSHMRSRGVPPTGVKCFTEYLRAAGYYCTNNSKTDYNFDSPPTAWDENSGQAHWRGRAPGQPFFAVFNIQTTHESQVRTPEKQFHQNTKRLRPEDRHDPAKAVLPAYYPDAPEFRHDWARYYDLVTAMDLQVADRLKELEDDGLADNTVVFFWGDHGRGLSRGKRWQYDSGLHAPLIVRQPGVITPGALRSNLVAFIDFAPTVLALAGLPIPAYMQGQPFLGDKVPEKRKFVYGARDRMDERYDIIRSVRNEQFHYLRNFQPWKPYAQNINYMNQMPMMQAWRQLSAESKLTGAPALFMSPTKPAEELYNTDADPDEVNNLAGDPKYQIVLERFRAEQERWSLETRDLGLLPEPIMNEFMRPGGKWDKTLPAQIRVIESGDKLRVELESATPGASIGYRIGDGDGKRWLVYSKPLELPAGTKLRAIACRLGFQDSAVENWTVKAGLVSEKPAGDPPRDVDAWRKELVENKLLENLRVVANPYSKKGDLTKLVDDPAPAVRYWLAVKLGLSQFSNDLELQKLKAALQDPSPLVQIGAAEALIRKSSSIDRSAFYEALKDPPPADLLRPIDKDNRNRTLAATLPVLIKHLNEGEASLRLHAALVLDELGPEAAPAAEALKKVQEKVGGFDYVARVAEHALAQIKSGSK